MTAQFPDEQSEDGEFERQEDAFRGQPVEGFSGGRYHLYVSLACPWACRTLIVRNLSGLQDSVGLTIVDPVRDERGWTFFGRDPETGFAFLSEAYSATEPDFRGRLTVPVLWDRQERKIVNNSEDDICRFFSGDRLFPPDLAAGQAELSQYVYEEINNGVYRAGFATSQAAYERACRRVFAALDRLEARLAGQRWLFGERLVETDWRLFCTLVRFDAVYHGHFKCNVRRIVDYPYLDRYLRALYQLPGIAETVDFSHIKRHYYMTHRDINPTGIVPIGPALDLSHS